MQKADMTGSKININECGGCGGRHEDMAVSEFSTPRPAHTHWFSCPTTQDPVALAIVQEDGKDIVLSEQVMDHFAEAQACAMWLTAVFRIDEGQLVINRMKSDAFPYADLQTCVNLLANDLAKIEGPPDQQPMTEAAPIPSSVNLFGE